MTRLPSYASDDDLMPANRGAYFVSGTAPETSSVTITATASSNVAVCINNTSMNRGLTSPAYTFTTTVAMYRDIFSAQCARVHTLIYENLEQLDHYDDDYNEKIINRITDAIDLVGEPAYCTAFLEARQLRDDRYSFERLLLAIGGSRHRETEGLRLEMLRSYAESSDSRSRRAAVRALGRMDSQSAKSLLRKIGDKADCSEIAQMATALLR
jgi:hypothetical protein